MSLESDLLDEVVAVVDPYLPLKQQMNVYRKLIRVWEQRGYCGLEESSNEKLRQALKDLHPGAYEEDEFANMISRPREVASS